MIYAILTLLVLIALMLWGICGLLWRISKQLQTVEIQIGELGTCFGHLENTIRNN